MSKIKKHEQEWGNKHRQPRQVGKDRGVPRVKRNNPVGMPLAINVEGPNRIRR